MNPKSHLPLILDFFLKRFAILLAAVIAGSAFAQVKSPPAATNDARQIVVEIKVIDAPEGTMSVFKGAKPGDPPPTLTAEEFQAGLRKLEVMKDVETVSAPKVITRSGQRAVIEIAPAKDESKRVGLKFDVLPKLAPDGSVELEITYTTASPKNGKIETRALKTKVSIPAGHTLVTGSMIEKKGRMSLLTVTPSIVTPTGAAPAPEKTALAKAKTIIFPRLVFRDATVPEVLEFLRKKSREFDPEKKGVNLVLKPGPENAAARINLELTDTPLSDVLKYVSELAGMKLREEENAIVISAENP